jgi:hypothetical protein
MERIVPAVDATSLSTASFTPVRHTPDDARAAGVVPDGAQLSYSSPTAPPAEMPDDFPWVEPVTERPKRQAVLEFDTIEFAAVDGTPPKPAARPAREERAADMPAYTPAYDDDVLPAEIAGPAPGDEPEVGERPKRGLFSGLGRKRDRDRGEVKEWLGVDQDFDARKAGKDIGSWDNFGEDDDDDGFGWKGGHAGDDPIGDPEFAASEAARIRRRVTESVDRELTEKEVWFVATGAEEVGTFGMQALLRDYGDELRDAFIINIDGCGAGQLYWASSEGMSRRYRADRRLVGLARRVSRETETMIKPREYKGLSTDASPALARGYHAMSIMAFDASGMPVNWHWNTDTVDNLDAELIEKTAQFVTAMVREA